MAARPRKTIRGKALRLACWNADGVRGRKLEVEHFLSQIGVDICLLIEIFLNSGQAFRLANYVCHRTDRPSAGGGTAILVRRGIIHPSVPVPNLTHLETTAIQVIIAGRAVKILAAYLSLSRPLIGADLSACFRGGCRSYWHGTSTPNTWIGTRGFSRDGGNSYVITPTRTPV